MLNFQFSNAIFRRHSIHARVILALSLALIVAFTTFAYSNIIPNDHIIQFSKYSDRSNSINLKNSTVSGTIYVFSKAKDIKYAGWYLYAEGASYPTKQNFSQTGPHFDFIGTNTNGTPKGIDTRQLAPGKYFLFFLTIRTSGAFTSDYAEFNVATTATSPTTTTTFAPTTTKPATTTTVPQTTTTKPTTTTTAPPSTGVTLPRGPSGAFKLHWNDEFEGTTLKTHWNPNWLGSRTSITPPINSHEGSCYDPANVAVRSGELVLKVEARNSSSCQTRNGQAKFASGMVESSKGFRWTYGYAEARVFTPATSNGLYANFPAFWSNGNNWPVDGEIDVFEGIEGYATHNYHHSGGSIGSRDANAASNARAGQWNTYGVLWEPGRLEYYVNGVLQRTVTSNVVSTSHYLIINHGVIESGSDWDWAGSRTAPAEMRVDWVRVWKR